MDCKRILGLKKGRRVYGRDVRGIRANSILRRLAMERWARLGEIVSRVRNAFRDDDDGDKSEMAELGIRTSTLRDNDPRRFTVQLEFC